MQLPHANKEPLADHVKVSSDSIQLRLIAMGTTALSPIIIPILFLRYANIYELGLWSLIISLGGFANLLDLGLIQVVTTSAIQEFARGNSDRAKRILNSLFGLLMIVVVAVTLLILISNAILKFNFPSDIHNTSDLICLYSVNITIGLLSRFFEGSFRAVGKLTGMRFMVIQSYLELLILSCNLIAGNSLKITIVQMISTKTVGLVYLFYRFQSSTHTIKLVKFGTVIEDLWEFRFLGISFLAMPAGYLAINEIANVSIGSLLGLKLLGIFSILKSISGVFRQITGIFTLSIQPALTQLLASGKATDCGVFFFAIRRKVVIFNTFMLITLLIIHDFLQSFVSELKWITFACYALFLVCAYLDIWWLMDSIVLVSNNEHQGMSIRFLISATIGTVIGCLLLQFVGIAGMALGTLTMDIILTPYCARARNSILQLR